MRPDLSIICPTIGRPFLEQTLRSMLLQQTTLTWEVVLVGDSHVDGQGDFRRVLDTVPERMQTLWRERRGVVDSGCFFYEHNGEQHMVGMPQRNFGMTVARGRWLAFMDDDNVYLPGAFEAIKQGIEQADPPQA